MSKKRVLAFDIGASNGRCILGEFDGKKISIKPIHRFQNNPVIMNGSYYWDGLHIWQEMKNALIKAKQSGGFDSVSVSTWGCDFALMGKDGTLIENLASYRDILTIGI